MREKIENTDSLSLFDKNTDSSSFFDKIDKLGMGQPVPDEPNKNIKPFKFDEVDILDYLTRIENISTNIEDEVRRGGIKYNIPRVIMFMKEMEKVVKKSLKTLDKRDKRGK